VLTAAAADQNALDDYKVNGLFTYLLLDALGEWRHQQRWPDRAERACRTHPDAGAEVDRQVNGARTRQQAVSGRLLDALKSSSMAPRLFVDARQKPKMRSRGEDFALVNRLLALSAAAQ
jgi:hypothetical protein